MMMWRRRRKLPVKEKELIDQTRTGAPLGFFRSLLAAAMSIILTFVTDFPAVSQDDRAVETALRICLAVRGPISSEIGRTTNHKSFPLYLLHSSFSTGFTSVHGERPSTEYAKLRKESLESEFGHALGTYSSKNVSMFLRFGPFLAFYRAAIISFHVLKLAVWQFFVHDIKKRSVKLGQALSTRPDILPTVYCQELAKLQDQIPPFSTRVAIKSIESQLGVPVSKLFADISPEPIAAASLGQVYKAHLHSGELVAVKVQRPGMALSLTLDALLFHMIGGQLKRFAEARKDLLVAVNEMVRHMFEEIDYVLEGHNAERFASMYACYSNATHTQVVFINYPTSKEDLTCVVARTSCRALFLLDTLLLLVVSLRRPPYGTRRPPASLQRPPTTSGDYHSPSYSPLQSLSSLFLPCACIEVMFYAPGHNDQNSSKGAAGDTATRGKASGIKVPKIYWNLTRKAVLTMEWIDGIKLTDELRLQAAFLDRKDLIDQGMYCSLRQLLEVGFFHADPHPGNLVATEDGSLAYFDFGMMGDIPRHYRVGLIQVLVHFVNRDSLGLANDFLSLGFLPEGVDIKAVSDALQASFGDGTRQSRDFQSTLKSTFLGFEEEIMLPPLLPCGSALRMGLASKFGEAIMSQLYDVMYEFNFSLPPDYALVIRALGSLEGTAKALDPDFKVVESAYPFVIGRLLADPSPDMRRILRELIIRSDGSIRWNRLERLIAAISEQASESVSEATKPEEKSSNPLGWKSFDMRAVVSATEDLFQFILSDKGLRVRIFLARDIIKAADIFLQDEVIELIFNDKVQSRDTEPEGHAMLTRVVNGFKSFRHAMNLAPEMWTAMLIRMALKPEVHKFAFDIISTLVIHSTRKIPEALWICISRVLHKVVKNCSNVN
ncbi:hypothetical protein Vadar_006769 [Vaccinium darrowii]|uniref:Uncharacterized protein n=1 Tax=Vaccinium darrowii TaxID=229202 RepID=A0ACB7XXB7_9ERIC|nr:hypothetical protein Vadar_006769 [Vaccinium darrowii]